MTRLFQRDCRLVIGNREIRAADSPDLRAANSSALDGLRESAASGKIVSDSVAVLRDMRGSSRSPSLTVRFKVEKSLKKEPNTAEIEVVNLSEETRQVLQNKARAAERGAALDNARVAPQTGEEAVYQLAADPIADPMVVLEAGYRGAISTIFVGDLRRAVSEHNAPDWITRVRCGDGDKRLRSASIEWSFDGPVRLYEAIEACAAALGLGRGNLLAFRNVAFAEGGNVFTHGLVLSGKAASVMNDLMVSAGLEWSVQDNELQVLERGKPLGKLALLLTPETGLVGLPNIDDRGEVSARCLMIPGLRPGMLIQLRCPSLRSDFRAERLVYSGDTSGQDWYVDVVGQAR